MFSKVSFQKKLFMYFGLVITIIIISFISAFAYYSSGITRENLISSSSQILQKITEQFDGSITDMDEISFGMLLDTNIKEFVTKNAFRSDSNRDNGNQARISIDDIRKVTNSMFIFSYSSNINYNTVIFNFETGYAVSLGSIDNADKLFNKGLENVPVLKDLINNTGSLQILPPHLNSWTSSPQLVFSTSRKILDINRNELGYIEIQQSYNYLKELFSIKADGNYKFSIIDGNGRVFYPAEEIEAECRLADIDIYKKHRFESNEGYYIIKNSSNERELLFYRRSKAAGLIILLAIPLNEIYSKINSIIMVFILSGIFFLLITLSILYVLAGSLTKPLKQLRESVKNVSLGNLSVNIANTASHNEIHLLSNAFNNMFSRLDSSIRQLNESKERESVARFEALQSQINPHFIYNTLSTISAAAKQPNQMDKVSEMCRQLSFLLRYTTSWDSSHATIKNETDYTKNFLGLMKFRFGGQFNFSMYIPDELNEIKVPKVVLQPFLENCFKHAFSMQAPPWEIDIKGEISAKNWTISICDNGPGFSEETLAEINSEIQSKKERHQRFEGNGLGVLNTYNRLRFFFAEKLIFTIGNSPGKGAIIIFGSYL
ncbi:MAG: hypothetical protein A2Y21_00665 [Clostridiales bacterium GWC2_40_7]|nr:MAG: hypothetical protein A2Y21_00665 [Clostridiales bacterium GWC2_40_7]